MKNIPGHMKTALLYMISLGSGLMLYHYWQEEHVRLPDRHPRSAVFDQHIDAHGNLILTSSVPSEKKVPLIHVKTDVLDLSINPRGGAVVGATLLKYKQGLKDQRDVRILSTNKNQYYTAQSGMVGDHSMLFKSSKSHYTLGKNAKSLQIVLSSGNQKGIRYVKTFTLKRGQYDVDVSSKVINHSKTAWLGHYYSQIKRVAPRVEEGGMGRRTYHGMSYYQDDKPYSKLGYDDMRKRNLDAKVKGGWVAGQQHYFLTAWIANPNVMHHVFSGYQNQTGQYLLGMVGPELRVNPSESASAGSKLYVGPERVKVLNTLAKGLGLTIDYGWLWFISDGMMWLMQHIYQFVGNWGLAIILVTLVIKAAFFKLSNKSFKSMAKMSELGPKVKALQEQFGDDKARLQRETMALYSKEKINPLGGCLPLLIQLPFFIGLYWVLIESIDLRQAAFYGWIHDLSVKDPYYVLPILMGVSMLVQQLSSRNPAQDKNQQRMMMLMPVLFTFIFMNFPAGLVIYMITNNCLSVAQQAWSKRMLNKKKPKVIQTKI